MKQPEQHTIKMWDRFPEETDLAYKYFVAYLEMGAERSHAKVVQKQGKKEHYVSQLAKWSTRYSWVERVQAYDDYLITQILEGKKDVIDRTRARLFHLAGLAVDAIEEVLTAYATLIDVEDESGVISLKKSKHDSSLLAQKLKASEIVLKKIGVVDVSEDQVPTTQNTQNNYYTDLRLLYEQKMSESN